MPRLLPHKVVRPRRVHAARSCPGHRAWVRKHHCVVPGCAFLPIECAHVRKGTNGGTGLKPSDCYVISLCREHHREQHSLGEDQFEVKYGLDLRMLADEFALRSPHADTLRTR